MLALLQAKKKKRERVRERKKDREAKKKKKKSRKGRQGKGIYTRCCTTFRFTLLLIRLCRPFSHFFRLRRWLPVSPRSSRPSVVVAPSMRSVSVALSLRCAFRSHFPSFSIIANFDFFSWSVSLENAFFCISVSVSLALRRSPSVVRLYVFLIFAYAPRIRLGCGCFRVHFCGVMEFLSQPF